MGHLNHLARKNLKKQIADFEVSLVRLLLERPQILNKDDKDSLLWALSLARITKIKNQTETINLGYSTDRYISEIYSIISKLTSISGLIKENDLQQAVIKIKERAQKERRDVIKIFSSHMPKTALDEATKKRPLALVLSGGGGTSYVFLSVFEKLQKEGIYPSVIAGSSMGAVLGAFRAVKKDFDINLIKNLIEDVTWGDIAKPFSGGSKFSIPATFRLNFRQNIETPFLKDGHFLTISEMAIPLRICVCGISKGQKTVDSFDKYANLLHKAYSESRIIKNLIDITNEPLKPIYLGEDTFSKDFNVLDAAGFSSAIPGIFSYDFFDDDHMANLLLDLFDRENIIKLIDGGFIDNLPSAAAINAIEEGEAFGFDPLVLALDGFSPNLNRHWMFYPLMLFANENSKMGHELAHISIKFKKVLSPINFLPTFDTLLDIIKESQSDILNNIDITKTIVGPLNEPKFVKNEKEF